MMGTLHEDQYKFVIIMSLISSYSEKCYVVGKVKTHISCSITKKVIEHEIEQFIG
jgi:hypothetical protein